MEFQIFNTEEKWNYQPKIMYPEKIQKWEWNEYIFRWVKTELL